MVVIGIDFGGTKIEGIVIDYTGKVFKNKRVPTSANKSKKTTLNNLLDLISDLDPNNKISKIGIGTPGFYYKGKLRGINNVSSLRNFDLKGYLQHKTGKKVSIENDANCFVLAENKFGAAKGKNIVIGIILGTGVGGGIIINGKIYRGAIGSAGELGHHIIDPRGIKSSAGFKGDLESFCSGTGIENHYFKLTGEKMSAKDIFKQKNLNSKKIISIMISYLGIGLANTVNIFNPEMIVLGGGVSNSINLLKLRKEMKKHSISESFKAVRVVKNKLGDSAGVFGAAALAM